MRLASVNIDSLLEEQIKNHLKNNGSYDALREICLSPKPIKPVIDILTQQLKALAKKDITDAESKLIQQAHANQQKADTAEAERDKNSAPKYTLEKNSLEQQKAEQTAALLSLESLYIEYKNTHHNARSKWQNELSNRDRLKILLCGMSPSKHNHHMHVDLNHHHLNHHYLAHPHLAHHRFDTPFFNNSSFNPTSFAFPPIHCYSQPNMYYYHLQTELHIAELNVARLFSEQNRTHQQLTTLEHEKNKIKSVIFACDSRLNELQRLNSELATREQERHQRNRAPALTNQALSFGNAQGLNQSLQNEKNQINKVCHEKIKRIEEQIYPVMLNHLNTHIDSYQLTVDETSALKRIITFMTERQQLMAKKKQEEADLTSLEASLETNQQTHATKTHQYQTFTQTHSNLIHSNEQIKSNLRVLQKDIDELVEQRNESIQAALGATALLAISALPAYFLIQIGIMSPLVAIIGASVIGVVIIGLTITIGVFAIQAHLKEAEKNQDQERVLQQEQNIQNHSTRDPQLKHELQELEDNINTLKQNIENQKQKISLTTQDAEGKLNTAKRVELLKNTSIKPSRNHFFSMLSPSAPPSEEENNRLFP